ncbi:DUF3857 domain-containing protein [Gillisia sp. M10.2A]|uniref:DUF3857 domain-containing protein n=1 Tax=Gillisia lutea TaxID=2909668 RepID=A0ABS9EGJ8_9FLAO|nr:DUF3857 domain-containing protein [Gillisia lutea]MCF4102008.1 DUF3857 domain-containing protein [Gillisia lutea]
MKKIYLSYCLILVALTSNAQDFRYGKVSEEEVKSTSFEADPEANAVVLYREQNLSYEFSKEKGFELVEEIYERVKIYNKEGFDWATRDIEVYVSGNSKEKITGLKGETYNMVDGKLRSVKLDKDGIFEEEVNKYRNKVKFTMPAIQEGSVIEFKYTRISPFITSIDDIPLQYTIPIQKLNFEVSIPEYYKFNTHFNARSTIAYNLDKKSGRGSFTITEVNRSGGKVVSHSTSRQKVDYKEEIYEINKENIPALKSEPFLDNLNNYAGFLKMELVYIKYPNSTLENYAESWENVVHKINLASGFGGQLDKTGYFDDDLKTVLAGKIGDREKTIAILDFIKSKVKWNDYLGYYAENGVKDAYKDGVGNVGDINLMLTAMLRYAGLDANPVLLSTRNNGVPVYPTRKGFNYVVASVKVNGQILLLDATDENSEPNILPQHASNWLGRMVKKDGTSELVDLMNSGISDSKQILKIEFEDNLDISGSFTKIDNGHFAKEFRDTYSEMSSDDFLKELEEGKGDIIIQDVEVENRDALYEDLTQKYHFTLKNGIEKINENIYMKPMFFLAQNNNPFKAEERLYPIFFKYPSMESKTVYIKVPDNYEVTSLPESKMIELNGGQGLYKFIILQSGNYIRITSELHMNSVVFTTNDYESLKTFYSEMVLKNSETIVLTKLQDENKERSTGSR